MTIRYEVMARDGSARHGRLTTPHGSFETPAFAPVGTLGAVKGVTPEALESVGADLMLANLYHLALRPGVETISGLGGLHEFTGWSGPILTDSGGYQVFSLARLRTVDRRGVTFRNHVDGGELRFTPERVAEMQAEIGVDLAMMLDECPPWPVERHEALESLRRTTSWARAARPAWCGDGGFLGIVQGSTYRDLRERAVVDLVDLDFDGYAIGGVSVGEPLAERRRVVEWTAPELPEAKVRYLMGVGTPADLVHAVQHGIDLFDCVLPSRNARHGQLYTRSGLVRIKNARYRTDPRPIDADCECPACRRVSRAFLHHLIRSGELTAHVLGTLHNLRFYLDFVGDLREATAAGKLAEFAREVTDRMTAAKPETARAERLAEDAENPPPQD
jgi:queuine tRNA-ribosyltransferase